MKKIFIIIATFAISCLAIAQQHLTTGEYWFDSNYNSRTILGVTPSAGFLFNSGIDCNTLGTGLHVINLRFRQTGGQWSNTVSQLFLKTPQAFSNSIAACEYWLDNNYSGRMSQAVTHRPPLTFRQRLILPVFQPVFMCLTSVSGKAMAHGAVSAARFLQRCPLKPAVTVR